MVFLHGIQLLPMDILRSPYTFYLFAFDRPPLFFMDHCEIFSVLKKYEVSYSIYFCLFLFVVLSIQILVYVFSSGAINQKYMDMAFNMTILAEVLAISGSQPPFSS